MLYQMEKKSFSYVGKWERLEMANAALNFKLFKIMNVQNMH